jgi:hypothetical protein
MGLWSSFKSKLKKAWNFVKGAARIIVRVITEAIHRIIPGLVDLLFGFANWPQKHMRIKVLILRGSPKLDILTLADLQPSVDYAVRVFKDRFNVKLSPHHEGSFVDFISEPAPPAAINVGSGADAWGDELGEAGDFFASHLAGLVYPVTVFVVENIAGKRGYSLGPATDYVIVDLDGIQPQMVNGVPTASTLAHELGHACGLWHSYAKSNLMWSSWDRGDGVKWFQRNLFRSSRHVMYW